jgi:hypothetical protein
MPWRIGVAVALLAGAIGAAVGQSTHDLSAIKAAIRTEYRRDPKVNSVIEVDSAGVDQQFVACIRLPAKRPPTCRNGIAPRVVRIDVTAVAEDSASGRSVSYTPHHEPLEYTVTEVVYTVTKVAGKWTARAVRATISEEFIETP